MTWAMPIPASPARALSKTPNIDRLAREGIFLRQSYANSSVCSATRTGLITRYATSTGCASGWRAAGHRQ